MFRKLSIGLVCLFVFVSCGPKDPIVKPIQATDSKERAEVLEKVDESRVAYVDLADFEDYKVVASSVLEDNTGIGFGYSPEMAFDRDFSTAWCVSDGKVGGELTLTFADKVNVGKMGIVPGFARDEDIYFQNARITNLKVQADFGDGEFSDVGTYVFPDEYGMKFVDFEGKTMSALKFVIEEVAVGSKFDDICIAEIDFWSDYVSDQDGSAALDYYKENKAAGALRPNDIVDRVIVTDFTYALGSQAAKGEYGPEECESSFYPPTVSKVPYDDVDARWYSGFGFDTHAFSKINQYGRAGDKLDVKWEQREIDYYVDDDTGPDFDRILRDEWVTLASEKGVEVVEACNGELYAHAVLDDEVLTDSWRGMFGGGGYRALFLRNGKVVGSGEFYAVQ